MSHQPTPTTTQTQTLPSHSQNHLELARRIERFQEAAQDLLALYDPPEQKKGPTPRSAPCPAPCSDGETRCYYFSPGAVQHERKLLQQYHADDFTALLAEAHMLLVGVVKLMKTTPHEIRVKGYVIASLGCLLEQASALVLRMRNVYERVERVKEPAPAAPLR